MLLLPFLFVFPSLLKLMFAMQNSALYRYPTGRALFGKFKRVPFYYLREEKITSSFVEDALDCTFLCIGDPKCYSFNMAAFSDPKGLHLCELLATDKYRGTVNFFSNATFHHYSSLSPCESAPCKNGGTCFPEIEWHSYHCDCKPGFCGTHCERGGNRTCSEIKYCNPEANSTFYVIDPDGEGGVKPFKVFCNMTDKGGVGVTVVSHDSENRTLVDGYEDPGSYSRSVTYNETSILQLASLTAANTHCEQFIKYECHHSILLCKDDMYGWWVSRDNEKMEYWGGVDSDPNKRACSINSTCADSNDGCNCSENDGIWREDSGLLTDKSKLPVIQMRFGDTGDDDRDEEGYHTLGKLKCYGVV